MKKSTLLFFIIPFIYVGMSLAQDVSSQGSYQCYLKKTSMKSAPELNLGDSPNTPRHAFDVLNYKLNLDIRNCFITPFPKSYSATNEVRFLVDTALSSITLNAVNTSLTIDSVRLAGTSFVHASNLLTINLDRTYAAGETTTVRIYYRHNNVTDAAFYTYNGMVFTDCEPEGARKWFPCWDKPSDKATVDLTAKTPANVKLGSNGRLADSTTVGDSTWFHWVSRDPVSTYLTVMTGKVNYNLDIVFWHPPTHPADSIPIRFYWNSGESVTHAKQTIIPMITHYSDLFGEHPFEKNGFATIASGAGFVWGGMENQTLTSFCPGCWDDNLMSHEFAHQWFGDMITCGTWADIWQNEGFASYCEALWYEYTGGYTSYKSDIVSFASSYMSGNPGWPMYNPSWAIITPDVNTLFNYSITYAKGACVLHMLRYTLGDSLFFAALKSYATDAVNFKYGNVVTADFVSKVSEVAGQDMSWFFAWVYQANHPVYANTYNITSLGGGQWMVGFKARQTSANFFPMPLTLRISFTTGADTTFRVMNMVNNQVYGFRFGRQPTTLVFDPNNDIVIKQGGTTVGSTVAAPHPLLPVIGAIHQPLTPTLVWNEAPSAASYHVQIATDSSFTTIAFQDSTITDTSNQVGPLLPLTQYFWRVRCKNSGGISSWSPISYFMTNFQSSVPDDKTVPKVFSLNQNYPNPFNPTTYITYGLPRQSHVNLAVFNLLGQQVAVLVDGELSAGYHDVAFDGTRLASGVYLYRLQAGEFVQTRKLVLMK